MEARSQLRHRPTEKLPLVYTSEADGRVAAELTAEFRQRTILTGGVPGNGRRGGLDCSKIHRACAGDLGLWGRDAGNSIESSA